jgi:hypothetical protein
MFDYLRDTINPRGAEYGATSRAAYAAQRNAEATEDLLELQLASSDAERSQIAGRIIARRERMANIRFVWRTFTVSVSVFILGYSAYYVTRPTSEAPQSAVNAVVPANASMDPARALAPEMTARAPAIDSCTVVDDNGRPFDPRAVVEDGFTAQQIADDCRGRKAHPKEAAANCLAAGLEKDCDGL